MSTPQLDRLVTVGFTPSNYAVTRDARDAPFKREMKVVDLFHHVIAYTHTEDRYELYHERSTLVALPREFYHGLFDHWDESYHRGSANHRPTICVAGSDRWDAFRLSSYDEANKQEDPNWSWVFASISWGSCGLHANFHVAPDNLEVDYEGSIRDKDPGRGIYFPALTKPWPLPIWKGDRYVSLGKLNNLLDPGDEKDLTMLIRAPQQPYQGIGKRLAGELRYIRNKMLEGIKDKE